MDSSSSESDFEAVRLIPSSILGPVGDHCDLAIPLEKQVNHSNASASNAQASNAPASPPLRPARCGSLQAIFRHMSLVLVMKR